MINISIPLSDIEFIGELKVDGTNGLGDIVYVKGQIGPLYIDTQVSTWAVLQDLDGSADIPDKIQVRIHLSL